METWNHYFRCSPVIAVAAGTAFTTAATAGSVVKLTSGSVASAMAIAAGTAVTSTAFVVASTTAATAFFTAGITNAVSQISDSIDEYNTTTSYDKIITESLIKDVVKEATQESLKDDDSMDNRIVYLGRNPKYYQAFNNDEFNKKFIFHLPDLRCKYLHNKYSDKGMWIFNKAFLTYAIGKAKTNNWKFRLVMDYQNYLTVTPFGKPGCFYSRELKELKDNNYIFSPYRTYRDSVSFFEVW